MVIRTPLFAHLHSSAFVSPPFLVMSVLAVENNPISSFRSSTLSSPLYVFPYHCVLHPTLSSTFLSPLCHLLFSSSELSLAIQWCGASHHVGPPRSTMDIAWCLDWRLVLHFICCPAVLLSSSVCIAILKNMTGRERDADEGVL